MTVDEPNYASFAAPVSFPRGPADLTGWTHCPACFAVLRSTSCSACGLDLSHPAAAELHEASLATAEALERRLAIIGRIRYDTAIVTVEARAPEHEDKAHQSLSLQPVTHAVPTTTAAPAPAATPTPAMVTGIPPELSVAVQPRRSSVQVTLLIVGVSLLSVAAIFFLVYAFINFGIVWRSVIIGAITVAAFVIASVLKKRSLTATAEGIAAFGVVLIYLDAYALRANNLFGAAAADTAVYWGVTLIAAAIGFLIWHRTSGLRIPNIAGFATFAPGVGILVGGLTQQLDEETQLFAVAGSIALAGLVHALAARPEREASADRPVLAARNALPERAIVLATTMATLLAGFLLAFAVWPSSDWAPALAALAIALIASLHTAALLRVGSPSATSPFNRIVAYLFSAMAGIAASSALWMTVIRWDDTRLDLVLPALWAAIVALSLEATASVVQRKIAPADESKPHPLHSSLIVGAWASAGIVAVAMIAPAFTALASIAAAAARTAASAWSWMPSDQVARFTPDSGWAVLAVTALILVAALAWTVTGRLRARSAPLAWAAGFAAIAAAPELRIQWAVMGVWLLLAVISLVALLVIRQRGENLRHYRPLLTTTMISAGALGYLLGWATSSTWWIGTIVVVGILLASRALLDHEAGRATLLGFSIALTTVSVGFFADRRALDAGATLDVLVTDHVALAGLVAVAFLIAAAFSIPLLSTIDRRVAFWTAGVFAATSLSLSTTFTSLTAPTRLDELLLQPDVTMLVASAALLVGLELWLLLPGNRPLRTERIVASIAAGPALYLLFTAFAKLLELPQFVASVAPVTAALFAAIGALAVTTLRPSLTPRWARELGVVLVGVPAVVTATTSDDLFAWLVLLIAAVAALMLSVDADGLFSSRSIRRHLGWLAIALGTSGLWWKLSGDNVTNMESYVVPLFVVLVLVATFIQGAAERSQPSYDSRVAPFVTLAGILVSLVPLGVNEASKSPTTIGIYFLTAIVLLISGSATIGTASTQWNADAVAAGGAISVIAIAGTRAAYLESTGVEREVWLAAAVIPLAVAAFLQVRPHRVGTAAIRATAGQWLAISALTLVLVIEAQAFGAGTSADLRAASAIVFFSAVHVLAFLVNRAPLTQALGWVALGFAAVSAVLAYSMDVLDPIELASVPIAVALIASSARHLATVPSARSWPRLGPATILLLVPSLIVTIDDNALWRLVALGVVGVAVIVIAVVRRLQAPFVVGIVVVLWHGIATFLPQLRAAYEFFEWWLWLGFGGVLLIVLAARYERRIRDLKKAVSRFAALR